MGFGEVGTSLWRRQLSSLMSFLAPHAMVSEPQFPHLYGEINTASPDSPPCRSAARGLQGECNGFQAPHFGSEVQSKEDIPRPAIRAVLIWGGLG